MAVDPDGHQVKLLLSDDSGAAGGGAVAEPTLHRWTLAVNSVEESALFYQRLFGMEPVFTEACGSLLLHHPKKGQMTLPGSDQAKQQVVAAGTMLRLQQLPDAARRRVEQTQLRHSFSILVEDVFKSSKQLQAAGVSFKFDLQPDADTARTKKEAARTAASDPKNPPPRCRPRARTATFADPNGYWIQLVQRGKPEVKRKHGETWFDGDYIDPGNPEIRGLVTGLPTMYRTLH